MRLHSLDLTNFGPHRHLSLPLAPLTVITGGNGTGKSSIAEALRLALTGDWLLRGLTRKQDRAALLSDGAEAGSITVEGDAFRAAVNIKTGKVERTPGPTAYLEQCCDPRLIVDQPTADLRAMLLDLLEVDINRVGMQAELIARGHDPDRVGAWVCGQDCDDAAAQSRGAWKSITGETYGSVKAETWRTDAPTVEPGTLESVAAEIAELMAQSDALREAAAKGEALREARARFALLQAKAEDPQMLNAAARVERLRADLEAAESEPPPVNAPDRVKIAQAAAAELEAAQHAVRAAASEKLSAEAAPRITPCPHCSGPLTTTTAGMIVPAGAEPARDHARIARAVREHAIAQGNLRAAERRLDDVIRADAATREAEALAQRDRIASLRAELRITESAAAELPAARAALAALGSALSDAPCADDAVERAAEIATALRAAQDRQRQMQEAERAAAAAIDRTARAAAAHADAQAWVALGDAVEALPNEMLAAGLAPLNALLRELAGHARPDLFVTPRGLPLVPQVSPDMVIRCGHRPYHAFSDSERWRIDALLGAAVASLSGHRLLVLDEADLLQPSLRPALLGWLDALVTAGHIETVLVMATTREPFRVPKHVAQFRLPAAAAGEEAAA